MFNTKNFSVMAYANGFTLWNYTSEDAISAIKAADYFNETAPFARKGDMILTVSAPSAASAAAAVLFVADVSGGVVTVGDILPANAG